MTHSAPVSIRLKATVIGVMLSMSMGAAQAVSGAIGDLGGLSNPGSKTTLGLGWFTDIMTFSLTAPTLASFAVQSQPLDLGVFVIPGASGLQFSLYQGVSMLAGPGASFTGLSLSAGADYSFKITGYTGVYSVNWAVSPVPEPQALVLALAGLGVMGGLVRRRLLS